MSYNDKKLCNTHQVRVRFNDYVYDEFVACADENQEQIGVFARKIIVSVLNNPELLKQIIQQYKD